MKETQKSNGAWAMLRRFLVGAAIFATLIALFYAEEDWRGKRDWNNFKRDMEAKGIVMDWEKLIPPPVPDDQNFFKGDPSVVLQFVRIPSGEDPRAVGPKKLVPAIDLSPASNSFARLDTAKTGPIVIANLTVLTPNNPLSQSQGTVHSLNLNDADTHTKAAKIIRTTLGEMAVGSQGFNFSASPLDRITPAQILLQADTIPSPHDLENLISLDTVTNPGHLRVQPVEGNPGTFQVLFTDVKISPAADYLKWSDQFEPFFDGIRNALKRPATQIEGNYSMPYKMPVPNFILMRTLVQTLAQRAQCDLLLGRPEEALRELTLLHDSCRILENAPTGRPLTLVASMINVAISSVYVSVIRDGLRWHSWDDSQLVTLQEQLKTINLPALVNESLTEQAAESSRTLETLSGTTLKRSFSKHSWSDPEYRMFRLLNLMPRGWLYQNMIVTANLETDTSAAIDVTNQLIFPRKLEQAMRETKIATAHTTPWNLAASEFIPNITRAAVAMANNQTLADEAQVACALERYRLVHGEYPETAAVLVPQFINQLPHDIIGGQPLHYRRTDEGKFLLYSVGWNEKDDGGVIDTQSHADGHDSREYGDWVWE
jgi:hypothetical protein